MSQFRNRHLSKQTPGKRNLPLKVGRIRNFARASWTVIALVLVQGCVYQAGYYQPPPFGSGNWQTGPGASYPTSSGGYYRW